MRVDINKAVSSLKTKCSECLSEIRSKKISENEFEFYLKQPLNELNKEIKGFEISEEDKATLKQKINEVMSDYTKNALSAYNLGL